MRIAPRVGQDCLLIDSNCSTFRDLVCRIGDLARRGQRDQSLVWAQVAAQFATYRHTGAFRSAELEDVLLSIGNSLPEAAVDRRDAIEWNGNKTRILHVLTRALVGGHTRVVERWILNTKSETSHAVVATAQTDPLTPGLERAIRQSAGDYRSLARPPVTLARRALLLRHLARSADVVVLHTHPYDVVPTVAFASDGGPPVLLYNHSLGTFWLGVAIADVVAEMHPVARQHSGLRRAARASALLPIPLPPPPEDGRAAARKRLGLGDGDILLFSSGDDFKYTSVHDYRFLDAAGAILRRNRQCRLIVGGVVRDDPWRKAAEAGLPIEPVSIRDDISDFHAAADIFLDPIPDSSLTAALELGARGIPVLGRSVPEAPFFSSHGDPVFDGLGLHPLSEGEYQETADRLIRDAGLRHELGRTIAGRIRDTHMGAAWRRALRSALRELPNRHAVSPAPPAASEQEEVDRFLARFEESGAPGFGLPSCLAANSRYFGNGDRARLLLRALIRNPAAAPLPIRSYLPEGWLVGAKNVLRFVARLKQGSAVSSDLTP
jgi:hypothetical protein